MATKINGMVATEHEGWSVCYMDSPPSLNPWLVFHDVCLPYGFCFGRSYDRKLVCGNCNVHVPDETLGFIELCKWAGVRTGERHEYQG